MNTLTDKMVFIVLVTRQADRSFWARMSVTKLDYGIQGCAGRFESATDIGQRLKDMMKTGKITLPAHGS